MRSVRKALEAAHAQILLHAHAYEAAQAQIVALQARIDALELRGSSIQCAGHHDAVVRLPHDALRPVRAVDAAASRVVRHQHRPRLHLEHERGDDRRLPLSLIHI